MFLIERVFVPTFLSISGAWQGTLKGCLSKEVGMSKLPSYGQIENDEGWCAIETWNDEGWCARETWSWCNWLWWRVVREWDLTMMKGGARCNNTSCVNTSEKNWLWWRVVSEKGKWWRREVMMKGSGEEGKWWWRGVVMKGSGCSCLEYFRVTNDFYYDEGWCASAIDYDEGWCASETWSWCNRLWWRVVCEWDLILMQ